MSGTFSGFSEADIRKLNSKDQQKHVPAAQVLGKHNPKVIHNKDLKKILNEKIENNAGEPLPENAMLNKKAEPELEVTNNPIQAPTVTEQEITFERKINLEEFQARQKAIEEQNRKRREILEKALAVKTKQTQAEAQKLNGIREEFKKLDALLSGDVKILRKQIEIASLDFMEAEKKYFRIEKEFLDAKLDLHQKQERKELLTEHLCAIIEKNEERKADKLKALLQKLNLHNLEEEKPS